MKKSLGLILCCLLVSFIAVAQTGSGRYFLQLQNGQIVYADKLQYKSPIFKSNHFLVNDSLKYSPATVTAFQDDGGYYARIEPGNNLGAFAKRLLDGPRIDKFYTSRTTHNYGYSPYGYAGPRTSSRRIYYFAKDNGPLYLLNYSNLQESLADNASSIELLRKYKKDKIINTGVSVVGAGLLAAGAISSFSDQGHTISPLMYAGAGILGVQFVVNLFQKDKLTQAIEVYNYQLKQ